MSTQLTRLVSPSAAFAIAAVFALAACNRGEAPKSAAAAATPANAELSWARAALERNPEIEVVDTVNDKADPSYAPTATVDAWLKRVFAR